MDLEFSQNNAVAKLPLLKQGDYEMWKLRIEQYFQVQDYALWDVIENGNSFKPVPRTTANADATQARFSRNDATKNTQRTLLKQMHENFNAPRTESLDSIFNRLTNEVDTASIQVIAVSIAVSTVSSHDNTDNLSNATAYAFLENQPNRSQLVHEDLEQIHKDDLEEMDLKWQYIFKAMAAIDGAGFDWSYMADDEVPTDIALMDFSNLEEQKPVLKNVEKEMVQREVRPVWNNAMRTNHQNFSNSRRNFAPTIVLTKSDIVPISTARQSASRAATPVSAAKPINIDASKPLANSVDIAKGNKVTSDVGNQGTNAVKSSACWVWRPKIKVQDYVSKKSRSYICKRFDYGAPQDALKDQGYFDSGCSKHMTGNISYLTDFKEHDGGYVAFGVGAKGGKITGKGTIRTALNGHNKDKHGPSQASKSDSQERPNAKSSTKTVNTIGPVKTATPTYADYPNDPLMSDLEDAGIFDDAYDDRDEGTLVDLPPRKRAIGTKWVYRNKRDQREIVVRNKARLVAQGHKEEEGIDYDEVFALVARIEAIRLFLAYASFMDFIVFQMDMKSAFLYGTIEEEVYVSQPLGFVDPEFPDRVYKVEKALYGLHQAPRAWYETLSTYLLDNRFRRGTIDKTLFIKKIKDDILLVQVYVDDIIFGSTERSLSIEFEQLLHKRFQMSSIGELTFFLRLQVDQRKDGIFLSQDKYFSDILKKFGFSSVKSASTSMETHKPLSKDAAGTDVDVHLYRSMIGSLMYLTSSRLDIMFVVCACSSFQVQPKVSHMHAVKRIFTYLKGQPTLGLWYTKNLPLELIAYSDSDYAGASIDRKSTTGGFQFLGSRLISWQCKKQTIVANSTTETQIHVDNESVICVVKNHVYHSKTKHIEIRHHFIRDSYEKRLIEMVKMHTDYNVADLFTKAFDVTRFQFLIASIVQKLVLVGLVTTAVYICIGVAARSFEEGFWILRMECKSGQVLQMGLTLKGYLINDGYADLVQHAGQTETGKEFINPLMVGSLPKTTWPTLLTTLKIKTVNDNVRLQALIDENKVVITEASIRYDLKLNDAEGTSCLPNAVIFEDLARIGTMASAIICLTNNQKFNFLKYILDNLKKILEAGVSFYMFPRFVQVFVNHQIGDLSHHACIFVNPSLTKKVFANIKIVGTGFSRVVTPLFDIMMVQPVEEVGDLPAADQDTPIPDAPSSS
nr:hypothetical protein [Tanacetum cinerariifolium]